MMRNASPSQTIMELAAGDAVGSSDWIVVDQEMIDGFSKYTLDPDPMHIDPEWAAVNGPFGGSIAFGFLTMSLLTNLLHSAAHTRPGFADAGGYYLNYGFDRLRLVSPVPAGARIRGHFKKSRHKQDEKGRVLVTFDCVVEIDKQDRPALIAQWLTIWIPFC